MTQYLFSNFKDNEFENLFQQLANVFSISQKQLTEIYEEMRKGFEREDCIEYNFSRSIFHSSNECFQKLYDDAWIIGVDIPSILELNNNIQDKKTIVILGQDPRRQSDKRVEEIEIATPYALHLKYCREKHRSTRLYFDLIKVLLEQGYRVYLTDVFKIWISQSDNGIYHTPLIKQEQERFIKILKLELEIFEPHAVITWGQVASDAVNSITSSFNHFKFPHPSPANNHTWSKMMGKPATRANRIDFWQEKVMSFLNNL
ncbi:uracil-DNA glycosylase family protein [Aulosira sp. FACHB-615]|uniref:uracil-DNA glycosylase family protein n=1 Tax=Aulosira sp. FACHB-615 TaxID=2692777 RepID=UPI001682447D|nr:uracil-DNA glycosylase family protein [Aulosira sp. FACHB-615]MBD2492102.1 uracil-DNA glycosylase [Aulosira sp. FACHB-615]